MPFPQKLTGMLLAFPEFALLIYFIEIYSYTYPFWFLNNVFFIWFLIEEASLV